MRLNKIVNSLPSIEIEEIEDFIKKPMKGSSSSFHILCCNKEIIEFCNTNRFKQISDLIDDITADIVELSIIKEIVKDISV